MCTPCQAAVARHLEQQARSFQTARLAKLLQKSSHRVPLALPSWQERAGTAARALCAATSVAADLGALVWHLTGTRGRPRAPRMQGSVHGPR